MIFERAARREFAQAAAGISVALLAILTSTHLIRLLKEAAGGRIAPEAVASLLGFAALNFMPILLSLTLFVAILLSLSRVYRDSEMVVWFSSGLPLTGWVAAGTAFRPADCPGDCRRFRFSGALGQFQLGGISRTPVGA